MEEEVRVRIGDEGLKRSKQSPFEGGRRNVVLRII